MGLINSCNVKFERYLTLVNKVLVNKVPVVRWALKPISTIDL